MKQNFVNLDPTTLGLILNNIFQDLPDTSKVRTML